MLRPFAHPVACCFVLLGVVASVYTPMSNNVESCCVCLHVAFIRLVFCILLITVDSIKCFKNIFFLNNCAYVAQYSNNRRSYTCTCICKVGYSRNGKTCKGL